MDEKLIERLRELLANATTPNSFDWHFPWRVVPDGGKPIIVGSRSGSLFRGFIGTWQEADLIVETINALPTLLAALESLSPPPEGGVDERGECPSCREAQDLARADKDRRIEIALKMLVARWPIAIELSLQSQSAIVNAMEDFAQALNSFIGSEGQS